MKSSNANDELFRGLTELVASSFPKTCGTCGRVFMTAEQFLKETQDIPLAKSCLKEAREEDGTLLVEVFRNCPCGSTLMDEFSDRRDQSPKGKKRRETFGRMLQILEQKGVSTEVAKAELIKATHGHVSELLKKHLNIKGQSSSQQEG